MNMTPADKIMAGDSSPETLAALEAELMLGTELAAEKAASHFKLDGGINSPDTPPHRQAALVVACRVAASLRKRRDEGLAAIAFGRGEDGDIQVSVQWDERNEGLRVFPEGGGSLPASNGSGVITTPAGEFPFKVSRAGTSDGYQYLSDRDAWASCPDARASVGHP